MKVVKCEKCCGTGHVTYGSVSGRVCFDCKGSGVVDAGKILKTYSIISNGVSYWNVFAKNEDKAIVKAIEQAKKRIGGISDKECKEWTQNIANGKFEVKQL